MLLFILGIILFIALVVVHEWGHFIMARRNGVDVEEFGIFFPPRLFKHKTKNGWLFTINLLPLGGFVKLKGEHDTDKGKGTFGAASTLAKSKIIAAGVTMNLAVAYLLLVLLAIVGIPHLVDNQFTIKSDTVYTQHAVKHIAANMIEKSSPAQKAGIKTDDILLAIGPAGDLTSLGNNPDQLPGLTKQYQGQQVVIKFERGGKVKQAATTLRSSEEVAKAKKEGKQIGYLGLNVYQTQKGLTVSKSTWSAPIVAGGLIKQYTVLTFQGLGKALAGLGKTIAGGLTGNTPARQAGQSEASSQVSGPVGIFFIFKYGSELGYKFILLIVAVLSLTLAIMNILPIPALDGGRLWIMLFTRAIKKPLSPKKEEIINATGFIALILLIILISVVDVKRFF